MMALCRKPYMARGTAVPFGCGQCVPCRVNRARQWSARQELEALCHDGNCFVTLTYDNDHLPHGGTVEPRVVQLFLKRLRKALDPQRIRFFSVGEYGSESQRPHYHLSLFGVSGYQVVGDKIVSDHIKAAWPLGMVHVGDFSPESARYVTGYVVKGLKKDHRDLNGRHPEFARMSNRPGLGAAAMGIVAAALNNGHGMMLIEDTGDVPRELKVGRRTLPLGRYMLAKLRDAVGFQPEYVEELKAKLQKDRHEELLALFASALDAAPGSPLTFRSVYVDSNEGKLRSIEAREKIKTAKRMKL